MDGVFDQKIRAIVREELKLRGLPSRHGQKWDDQEDEELINSLNRWISSRADGHGRSHRDIADRVKKLMIEQWSMFM